MPNDSLPPTADAETLLHEVVSAGRAHRIWLTRWHRHVICRLPRDPEFSADDGHNRCRFGRWFEEFCASGQPSYRSLARLGGLHADVHREGQRLAHMADTGARVDAESYDAFALAAETFARAVLDFERAMRTRVAERDPLTDIPNRRAMLSRLEDELDRIRHSGGAACLAMIDIDHFKTLNDTHGHPVGDEVLRRVTARLREEIRPYDLFFRYGGDEFLLCLRDVTPKRSQVILERIRERVKSVGNGITAEPVTLSIGACELNPLQSVEDAIHWADAALYHAKRGGRDRLHSTPEGERFASTDAPESGQ